MPTHNEITGDAIKSKASSQEYRDNFDAIFSKKKKQTTEENLEAARNKNKGIIKDMSLDLEPMQKATPERLREMGIQR